jgi:glutamyl-tRNA reductase
MRLLLIGTNHKSSPAEVRDDLFMTSDEVQGFLEAFREQKGPVEELAVLSTCNRTELYGAVGDVTEADLALRSSIRELKGVAHLDNGDYTYLLKDRDAVTHLFRVASGVDSLMVGEPQILGQVREASEIARAIDTAGALMTRLFQAAAHTGKRARAESEIGRGAVSVAYAAVGMARKVYADITQHHVLIVGAGETGTLSGQHFADEHPASITVVNRTFERAQQVAEELGASALPFEELEAALGQADIVVTATAATEPVIRKEMVGRARKRRGRRPMVIIDIASPRDVEPEAGRLSNVFLYDLDTLQDIVEQNRAARSREIPKVERIITEEVGTFFEWYDSLGVVPIIKALRGQFLETATRESKKRAKHFSDTDRQELETFTRSLINKLLHNPTLRLKELDRETSEGLSRLEAIRDLFGLDLTRGEDETRSEDEPPDKRGGTP